MRSPLLLPSVAAGRHPTRPRTSPVLLVLASVLLLAVTAPGLAAAQGGVTLYQYFDAHPIPGGTGAEVPWCLIEGTHTHRYSLDPEQDPIYVMDDTIFYVGDSLVTGAPIEAVWYWGAHPIAHLGGAWCVLDGPHAHYWRPWWRASAYSSSSWAVRDGYWTWVSGYDDWYHWSYNRWYTRQHAIQVRYLAAPRYAPRYSTARHPGVVYSTGVRVYPTWDSRRRATDYRGSRTVVPNTSRDGRYGRSSSSSRSTASPRSR